MLGLSLPGPGQLKDFLIVVGPLAFSPCTFLSHAHAHACGHTHMAHARLLLLLLRLLLTSFRFEQMINKFEQMSIICWLAITHFGKLVKCGIPTRTGNVRITQIVYIQTEQGICN